MKRISHGQMLGLLTQVATILRTGNLTPAQRKKCAAVIERAMHRIERLHKEARRA
jgi:hypothetical protein